MRVRLLSLVAVVCLAGAVVLLAQDAGGNLGYALLLFLVFALVSAILVLRAAFNKVRRIVSDARAFIAGDIQHARLIEVSDPKGIFFTRVNFVLELEGADAKKHRIDRN